MNFNYASQNQGVMAWDGTTAAAIDLRHHIGFSFTFQTVADIAADTDFEFEWAPPSPADPCVAGAWSPVMETLICSAAWGAQPVNHAGIIIPGGTKAKSICTGALPCKPGAFIRVKPGAIGNESADVRIIAVLSGPRG
jgi:hypothetical protein